MIGSAIYLVGGIEGTHALPKILRSPRSSVSKNFSITPYIVGPTRDIEAIGKTGKISLRTIMALYTCMKSPASMQSLRHYDETLSNRLAYVKLTIRTLPILRCHLRKSVPRPDHGTRSFGATSTLAAHAVRMPGSKIVFPLLFMRFSCVYSSSSCCHFHRSLSMPNRKRPDAALSA